MYSCWLLLVVHQLGNGFRQQASSSFLLCSVDKVTEREQQIDHFAGDSTIGTGAGYGNAINNAPRRKLGNCNFQILEMANHIIQLGNSLVSKYILVQKCNFVCTFSPNFSCQYGKILRQLFEKLHFASQLYLFSYSAIWPSSSSRFMIRSATNHFTMWSLVNHYCVRASQNIPTRDNGNSLEIFEELPSMFLQCCSTNLWYTITLLLLLVLLLMIKRGQSGQVRSQAKTIM